MDRRIRRTRTAVFNAVLDLMVEKDTSKITVLELCKRADINKSTFYLHYKSMEDCLQSCFQIIMNGIIDISKNHENRPSFLVFVNGCVRSRYGIVSFCLSPDDTCRDTNYQ